MQTEKQKIDFFKKDFEEYIKKARENDDYLSKISNGLRAGNQNQIFLLSDNFIAFEYYKDKSWNNFKLIALAYGLSKKNKKAISEYTPVSRSINSQTIELEIPDQDKVMITRYRIVVSEPVDSNCMNIESISNKFKHLFNSLNGTK
jgi:hypothetical protein